MGSDIQPPKIDNRMNVKVQCVELPTIRRYPKGEVPTKISSFKGNLSVLLVLFKACFGAYNCD